MALVTIGTGIGGGIAIDGTVVTGSRGEPPELGAMVLDPTRDQATGTVPGTFEHLACASAFLRAYAQHSGGRPVSGLPELFLRVNADGAADRAVNDVTRHIAQALGILINTLNLEACLIGGGVASAGAPLFDRIRRHLPDFTWSLLLRNVRVIPAERGNDA